MNGFGLGGGMFLIPFYLSLGKAKKPIYKKLGFSTI